MHCLYTYNVHVTCSRTPGRGYRISLMPSLHAAPTGEKQSDAQTRISWAYFPKVVRTNKVVKSVIIEVSLSEPHTSGTALHDACVCLLGYIA